MSRPTAQARVTLRREANGYAYEVRVAGRVVAAGWSAGTKREARDAARDHFRTNAPGSTDARLAGLLACSIAMAAVQS